MQFSELIGKEIVNISTGERIGVVGDYDLILDETSGEILALIIPPEKSFFGMRKSETSLEISWKNIRKIGSDMIIIDYDGIY